MFSQGLVVNCPGLSVPRAKGLSQAGLGQAGDALGYKKNKNLRPMVEMDTTPEEAT